MSEIGDELRRFSDAIDGYAKAKVDLFDDDLGCISYLNSDDITKGAFTTKWFRNIADRIDAEMAELPRDKNGKPIRVGETVFAKDDPGTSWGVRYIELSRDREPSIGIESGGVNTYRPPSCLTHERPDSLERIADEFDEWRFEHMHYLVADDLNDLGLFAERIRKLAEREASDGTD